MSVEKCKVCGISASLKFCMCGGVAYCGKLCQTQEWSTHKVSCPPVVVREVSGKGKGLVATRKVSPGAVIFSEDPLVVFKRNSNVLEESADKLQLMDMNTKNDFFDLFDPEGLESEIGAREEQYLKFSRIFEVNAVEIGLKTPDVPRSPNDVKGVYKLFSRINHSCSPNAVQVWNGSGHKMDVTAVATIKSGEELTHDYLGMLLTYKERKQRLEIWNFQCRCEVCSLSEGKREENDKLREFITQFMESANAVNVQVRLNLANFPMVLNECLQVLAACYSIEFEAKYYLPLVLYRCAVFSKQVRMLQLHWQCPKEVQKILVEKMGNNFMDKFRSEAIKKAGILGSEMLQFVTELFS